MLLGQFEICVLSEKNSFKNMKMYSFLGQFLRFPVHFLGSVKKLNFKFASEHEI